MNDQNNFTAEEQEEMENIEKLSDAMNTLFHGFNTNEIMHAMAWMLGEIANTMSMDKEEFLNRLRKHVSDTYDSVKEAKKEEQTNMKGLH